MPWRKAEVGSCFTLVYKVQSIIIIIIITESVTRLWKKKTLLMGYFFDFRSLSDFVRKHTLYEAPYKFTLLWLFGSVFV